MFVLNRNLLRGVRTVFGIAAPDSVEETTGVQLREFSEHLL
jgi:hypothetical protein